MRSLVRLFALFACISSPALAWEYGAAIPAECGFHR